jgi:hypothetical protein
MLQLENFKQFSDGLDNWLDACEDLTEGALRGISLELFKFVVQGTPQWSGTLAANWKLTVGVPSVSYSPTVFKEAELGGLAINRDPYSRRDPNRSAIRYAHETSKFAMPQFRLGADIYIVNTAPYAQLVETAGAAGGTLGGKRFLRGVNLPVEMVLAATEKFYRYGEISELKARRLAMETL